MTIEQITMIKCERVNLLKLQGQFLIFIVENHVELNILEHIEECEECQKEILEVVEKGAPLPIYEDLFQRNSQINSLPNYSDYQKPLNFINARIQWRKRKLKELIKKAEMELKDLESRL
jgi:hypothetical protein